MQLFKRFFFSIPFIFFFIGSCLSAKPFLQDPMLILSLDPAIFGQFIALSIFIILASLFFILFVTLNQDRKIFYGTLPAILLSAYLLLPTNINLVFSIGAIFVFILLYLLIERKLTTYITFDPDILLNSEVKQTATLLLIVATIGFYTSAKEIITTREFSLPKSFLETAATLAIEQQKGQNMQNLQLPPEQIAILKKNPDILKQFGIDELMLSQSATASSELSKKLIAASINQQITSFIKPYESFLPLALSFFFFLTIRSFISLFTIFLEPMLRIIFWLLDKTKYTHYEVETRQVKKLVV